MHTVSVIPITRGITKEELTYYTNEPVSPGDVVGIPLRKKEVPALVTKVASVKTQKAVLRSASFSVRKIKKVYAHSLLQPAFMKAVEYASNYFASTTGSLLNTLLPKHILTEESVSGKNFPPKDMVHEIRVLQDDRELRLSYYKSLVRELFAKKNSVLIVLPTRFLAEKYFEVLRRGIEKHAVLLHTGLTKKKQVASWQQALSDEHPTLVVATPKFLCIPRKDTGAVVIENENSRHYKANRKPYTDFRKFAEFLTKEMNIPLILSDRLVRLETLYNLQSGLFVPIGRPKMRNTGKKKMQVIDMSPYTKASKHGFRTISKEVFNVLENLDSKSENAFVFTLRKGLYPLTICGDCGNLVKCEACDSPVVVHAGKPNIFVCHRCNTSRSTEERCKTCSSWNLVPLGTGSGRVAEEIRQLLPKSNVTLIDPEKMTPVQTRKAIKKWNSETGGILVGTEVVLQFLTEVTHVAVASLDTLFSLPDFRAGERILQTLLDLQSLSTETLLVQTRSLEQEIFSHASSGNVSKWQRDELTDRKQLNYPPFYTLIKITTAGTKEKIPDLIKKLEENLKEYSPESFPAFTSRVKGKDIMHTLVSVPNKDWPNKKLVEILKSLSPQHSVQVNPEHLL